MRKIPNIRIGNPQLVLEPGISLMQFNFITNVPVTFRKSKFEYLFISGLFNDYAYLDYVALNGREYCIVKYMEGNFLCPNFEDYAGVCLSEVKKTTKNISQYCWFHTKFSPGTSRIKSRNAVYLTADLHKNIITVDPNYL